MFCVRFDMISLTEVRCAVCALERSGISIDWRSFLCSGVDMRVFVVEHSLQFNDRNPVGMAVLDGGCLVVRVDTFRDGHGCQCAIHQSRVPVILTEGVIQTL